MKIKLGYGNTCQELNINDKYSARILKGNNAVAAKSEQELIEDALEHPIGSKRLREIVKPGEKVVIVTSDITRPMPTDRVLPHILKELYEAGIKKKNIRIVFALGIHRRHTEEEQVRLVGREMTDGLCFEDSTPCECTCVGTTSRGTPVEISANVAEADRIICLGNIEFHYFAGFSGGGKALIPGVCSRKTIEYNHRLMLDPKAEAGRLDGNPVREDIDEAAGLCGIDFILNVVLSEKKEIVYAVSGDYIKAHREGCRYVRAAYGMEIGYQADIAVVSQGGAPKDLNLYQLQKALDNVKYAVRDDGIIILCGACQEGFGDDTFEEWLIHSQSIQEVEERLRRGFALGGHKAASIAMVLEKKNIYLVSEIPEKVVKNIFMLPFSNVQSAFDHAIIKIGKNKPDIIVLQNGGMVVPFAENRRERGKNERM